VSRSLVHNRFDPIFTTAKTSNAAKPKRAVLRTRVTRISSRPEPTPSWAACSSATTSRSTPTWRVYIPTPTSTTSPCQPRRTHPATDNYLTVQGE
jgi:hypothetical protein